MTLAPGTGCLTVIAVEIIWPEARSTACILVPLVPMSIEIPYNLASPFDSMVMITAVPGLMEADLLGQSLQDLVQRAFDLLVL
jgi:hypothetical protein